MWLELAVAACDECTPRSTPDAVSPRRAPTRICLLLAAPCREYRRLNKDEAGDGSGRARAGTAGFGPAGGACHNGDPAQRRQQPAAWPRDIRASVIMLSGWAERVVGMTSWNSPVRTRARPWTICEFHRPWPTRRPGPGASHAAAAQAVRNEQLRRALARAERNRRRQHHRAPITEEIARGAASLDRADSRRERYGKGTGGPLHPRIEPPQRGPVRDRQLCCLQDSLLESELFGHEAGAFTGADRRYIGQIERAHRGTIFLDEVGEMSPPCQAKLLRVLEGHPFQRLGGQDAIHAEVRVISATHRDLPSLISQKRFREDLYYRLRVIDISLPPLRERGEDVIALAAEFLESFRSQMGRGPGRLSAEAVVALLDHAWPGNVRELKNAVERAVVLGQGEEVQVADLGLLPTVSHQPPAPRLMSLKEAEKRHILWVLDKCGGNKTQACRILGIGRGTLFKKLGEHPGSRSLTRRSRNQSSRPSPCANRPHDRTISPHRSHFNLTAHDAKLATSDPFVNRARGDFHLGRRQRGHRSGRGAA